MKTPCMWNVIEVFWLASMYTKAGRFARAGETTPRKRTSRSAGQFAGVKRLLPKGGARKYRRLSRDRDQWRSHGNGPRMRRKRNFRPDRQGSACYRPVFNTSPSALLIHFHLQPIGSTRSSLCGLQTPLPRNCLSWAAGEVTMHSVSTHG